MMRRRMERLGDAEHRERAVADFPGHHERRDARDVGLKRDRHQVEHQFRVFDEVVGNAARRHRDLEILTRPFLGELDAPFDFTHGVEILGHSIPIAGTQPALQTPDLAR